LHYSKVLQSTYTDVGVYNIWRHLDAYYSALENMGVLESNPVAIAEEENPKDIDPEDWSTANPKKVKKHGESIIELDEEKIDKMVRECDTVRDKLIVRLLQDTGLRASEMTEVTVNQIEEGRSENEIDNVQTAKRDGHERVVFYKERTSILLTEYLEGGGRSRYKTAADSDYLFVTLRREQMHPNWLNSIVREAAKNAEVQEEMFTDAKGDDRYRYTAQHFRSNFAIKSVKNNMSLEMLRRLLGHAELETTRDAYLGFRKEDVRDAYNKYYA
jgi:integrase/recombinase XerD